MNTNSNSVLAQLEALKQRAESLAQNGQTAEAINAFIQISFRAPNHWPAYFRLGALFTQIGRPLAARAAYARAAALAPDNVQALVALALSLGQAGEREQALALLRRAVGIAPDDIYANFNLAELLLRSNHTAEALAGFERIVEGERDADNIKAISRWLRAVARLTLGDYANAWDDYESRVDHPTTTFPRLKYTKWNGQALAGKSIFLAYEQRFGDVIQFARFVPRLVEMGAHVVLQTPHELLRLFRSLGAGIDLIEYKEPAPTCDYSQLVTSIPAILRCQREDVWPGPYLAVDPTQAAPALPMRAGTRLKVGLVWTGKPVPNRSIPLAQLVPLLGQHEVSFYSFQLGAEREQMKVLAVDWLIRDLADGIQDFHDSAAFMVQMDLIITIDTAAAHQAGALGVPTWLLLVHYSDWRWGEYGAATTAWYPGMRIFRQTHFGSWDSAAAQLNAAFVDWVGTR